MCQCTHMTATQALTLPRHPTSEIATKLKALGCSWNGIPLNSKGFGWNAPIETHAEAQHFCSEAAARQADNAARSVGRRMANGGYAQ